MTTRTIALCTSALLASMVLASSPASALTAKECSEKYQTAKAAGTLGGGKKWNDFRKAECGAEVTPAAATVPPRGGIQVNASGKVRRARRPRSDKRKCGVSRAVDPKYSKETAGKARMHTCLDQYNANKATNTNGGLKWIQKGGGYYSECNKQLKG